MSTRDLVKMSAYLAMFIVLDYLSNMIGIFRMPQGGTLGLGVIALLLASYDLGWKKGVAGGLL
jgi:thiamine transporter